MYATVAAVTVVTEAPLHCVSCSTVRLYSITDEKTLEETH